MNSQLSVVIATYNEEKNIDACLTSIKDLAGEIIIVDGKSTDNTVSIAKKFTDDIYSIDNDQMFHKNKQYGLSLATRPWILQLDADERVSSSLASEIKNTVANDTEFAGFFIPRKNIFLGKWIKKGGLYPDYVIRLLKKDKGYFPALSVHEQIRIDGKVGYLKNDLLHYPYDSVGEYLRKANAYTTLTAHDYQKNNLKTSTINIIKYSIWMPISTALSIFIRHKGFYDKLPGFIWAVLSGSHHFLAFAKYYLLKNNDHRS